MARPSGLSKEQLMALAKEGAAHRERQRIPDTPPPPFPEPVAPPEPSPVPEVSPIPARATAPVPAPVAFRPAEDEPPAERPVEVEAEQKPGLPRARRVGLRSDPAWAQKTIYLRKASISAGEEIARSMGVEFSELVEYALAVQVKAETRSSELAEILARRSR